MRISINTIIVILNIVRWGDDMTVILVTVGHAKIMTVMPWLVLKKIADVKYLQQQCCL